MPALSSLIFAGALIVAPSHPASFARPAREVWLSRPRIVEAQTLGRSLVLRYREAGSLFAVGLRSEDSSPQRIFSTSDRNYAALARCSTLTLDPGATYPALVRWDIEGAERAADCGFDALGVREADRDRFESLAREAEARLFHQGLASGGLHWCGERRCVSLKPGSMSRLSALRQALGPLLPFYELRKLEGPRPGRTLVFDIHLFEFSRSRAASLGIRWPKNMRFRSLEGRPALTDAQGAAVEVGLDFGESLGLGRVLARPQIRTKPGEKAIFQSGGEIPIRNAGKYGGPTVWKNYGLLLTLVPDAQVETGNPEIAVDFKLELSEPDYSAAIDGVPGMKVRRLESRFDLRTAETTILTTLVQTRTGKASDGLYGTRAVPILQHLFGSQTRTDQDSELWFAIRPVWEEIRDEP